MIPIIEKLNNKVRYYKLSAKTMAHEFTLETQTAELTKPLRDALSKVKTMDELNDLENSDFYKDTMTKYQSLLKKRIGYHEQQMSQLAFLRNSVSTVELAIESTLRKKLLADYSKLLDSAKQNQL